MTVYSLMRTGTSGMSAQATRLGTVADNIANSSTTGYKAASVEFSSLVVNQSPSSYVAGGVEPDVRYSISQQGLLSFTASSFDLAIQGNGFFLVGDQGGGVSLTRAGAFVPDGESRLVNAAGLHLLGYPVGGVNGGAVNGPAGLEAVVVAANGMDAVPTTSGYLNVNLPSDAADVAAADLPSLNAATATSTARSSLVVIGSLGEEVLLDVHFAKTAVAGEWEVSVFDAAGRPATGGFPYAAAALANTTLSFDANGQLAAASASSIAVTVPGGEVMTLDLSAATQLAADYTVLEAQTNGNPPMVTEDLEFAADGGVYAVFENGMRRQVYQIPLATVPSPDRLQPGAGNTFDLTAESGEMVIGSAGTGGLGQIVSGALEGSNVDMASELTTMIEAQRSYTANSKVFQTGSELLEVLISLKR